MSPFADKLLNLLPNSRDDGETHHFKILVYLSVGIIILMIIIALVTFLLTVDGAEQTMVPNLTGMELANGLVSLQDRGLYPRVQLRYSANPAEKGKILAQEPGAGTIVKTGRVVTLQVSKGAIIDRVEDYIGMKLTDLELHLQTLSTTYGPLLQLQTPVTSVYDPAPAGTILQQSPAAGTPLTGLTTLKVVVSLGPKSASSTVPSLVGEGYEKALKTIADSNLSFAVTNRRARGGEEPGTIVSQSPDPGSTVPAGTLVNLVMTDPTGLAHGYVFGMLQKTLPDYPVAVDLTVEAVAPDGTRTPILTLKTKGGLLTVPYVVKNHSVIVVSSFDKELFRYTVGGGRETGGGL